MNHAWRKVPYWNIAVALSRKAIAWPKGGGTQWLRTKAGRIYDFRLVRGVAYVRRSYAIEQ